MLKSQEKMFKYLILSVIIVIINFILAYNNIFIDSLILNKLHLSTFNFDKSIISDFITVIGVLFSFSLAFLISFINLNERHYGIVPLKAFLFGNSANYKSNINFIISITSFLINMIICKLFSNDFLSIIFIILIIFKLIKLLWYSLLFISAESDRVVVTEIYLKNIYDDKFKLDISKYYRINEFTSTLSEISSYYYISNNIKSPQLIHELNYLYNHIIYPGMNKIKNNDVEEEYVLTELFKLTAFLIVECELSNKYILEVSNKDFSITLINNILDSSEFIIKNYFNNYESNDDVYFSFYYLILLKFYIKLLKSNKKVYKIKEILTLTKFKNLDTIENKIMQNLESLKKLQFTSIFEDN